MVILVHQCTSMFETCKGGELRLCNSSEIRLTLYPIRTSPASICLSVQNPVTPTKPAIRPEPISLSLPPTQQWCI